MMSKTHRRICLFAVVFFATVLVAGRGHADWLQRLIQFKIFQTAETSEGHDNGGLIGPMMMQGPYQSTETDAFDEFTAAGNNLAVFTESRRRPIIPIGNLIRGRGPALTLLPSDLGMDSPTVLSRRVASTYDALILEPNTASLPVTSRLEIEPGGSFYAILQSFGINANERRAAATVVDAEFPLTRLQAGWEIQVTYDASIADGADGRLLSVAFNPSNFETVRLDRNDGRFVASFEKEDVALVNIRYNGTIEESLWIDLQAIGFSNKMIQKLHNALSKRVNVDREIKAGARYEVVMSARIRESGEIIASGDIIYANIEVGDLSQQDSQDLTKEVYFFEPPSARTGWFTPSGNSLTSGVTFLRRPVEGGGRISSHFNPRRKHPVLNIIRPHNGVDLAAPTGTPVYASAAGQILRRETNGGLGKFIEIDHGGGWRTRYGHLNSYQSGLRVGSSVRQGQIIGFVGSTGMSTGPHLHFEILKDGVARDPIRASLPETISLSGADRTAFNRYKREVAELRNNALLFGEDVFVDL